MIEVMSVRFGMMPPLCQIPLGYRRLPGRRKASRGMTVDENLTTHGAPVATPGDPGTETGPAALQCKAARFLA